MRLIISPCKAVCKAGERSSEPPPRFCTLLQSGGPDGELGASMRYLSQRYSMPYPQVQALLTDIGTEGSEWASVRSNVKTHFMGRRSSRTSTLASRKTVIRSRRFL